MLHNGLLPSYDTILNCTMQYIDMFASSNARERQPFFAVLFDGAETQWRQASPWRSDSDSGTIFDIDTMLNRGTIIHSHTRYRQNARPRQ